MNVPEAGRGTNVPEYGLREKEDALCLATTGNTGSAVTVSPEDPAKGVLEVELSPECGCVPVGLY